MGTKQQVRCERNKYEDLVKSLSLKEPLTPDSAWSELTEGSRITPAREKKRLVGLTISRDSKRSKGTRSYDQKCHIPSFDVSNGGNLQMDFCI